MNEQTIIVTGGNAGIGKAIVAALAQMQMHVVIVSRDRSKGDATVKDILIANPGASIDLVVGDLGSIQGTRKLADELLERFPAIHVLINNAGVWMTHKEINPDGLEVTFMVNHLAPFLLSNLLLERLKANTPARIVNVNAGLYVNGKLDLEKTPYGQDFSPIGTYANTKLCNVLFTTEFAQRIEGMGVTINAVHPGVIRTNLGVTPGIVGWLLKLVKRSWASPEEGAQAPVWLATDPELAQVNGKYFDLKVQAALSSNACDENLARQLWDFSASLTGVG